MDDEVNATERFAWLVGGEADPPLDEAALLIAAHAHPGLDVAHWRRHLDELAEACSVRSFAGLADHCFATLGFAGDADDYGDPRNSYLDAVLTRRLGIPITLSVVMMELGRRIGVEVLGIGMPGHFVVRSGPEPDVFCDPFAGGRLLDVDGCRLVFERVAGTGADFRPEYLVPVGTRQILSRMLANLQRTTLERDRAGARWVARLRLRMPGLAPADRQAIAALLGALGAFTEAASELELIARDAGPAQAPSAAMAAVALRARAN